MLGAENDVADILVKDCCIGYRFGFALYARSRIKPLQGIVVRWYSHHRALPCAR